MRPLPHDTAIGQRIAQARKAQGLTMRALAERLDWPFSTLGNFESGRRSLTVSHLYAIAAALGRAPAALLMDTPEAATLVDALAADPELAVQIEMVRDALADAVPPAPE